MKTTQFSHIKKQIMAVAFAALTFPTFAQTPVTLGDLKVGPQNLETVLKSPLEASTSVKMPVYVNGKSEAKTMTYKAMEAQYLSSIDESLKYMNEFKSTDNVAFANLVASLSTKIQNDPEMSKNFRMTVKNGVTGISIGDPNIFMPLSETPLGDMPVECLKDPQIIPLILCVIGAFAAGYLAGTICVKAGPCSLN